MKGVLFSGPSCALGLEDLPDPVPEPGDVVVDVVAAPVLTYAAEVFDGSRPMLQALPFVPGTGAIGQVSALGTGAASLQIGQWVYCDPTLRARDGTGHPAIALQGLTANGPLAIPLFSAYRDGSWATKLRLPLENAVPLPQIEAADAPVWLSCASMLVPYGGFLSVELQAGECVVVNGATGNFGCAAVATALAMGACRVVATGRNTSSLELLEARFGGRVRAVAMTGDRASDTAAIQHAASLPIDVVLDILPPGASSEQVLAALLSVRPGGRVSLMGGVGMATDDPLSLPYPWLMRNNIALKGQWLYPRDAIARMIAMVSAKMIDLTNYAITSFPLASFAEAIAHAGKHSGPFDRTVLMISEDGSKG